MKFNEMKIGHSFIKGESTFMKIQEVVPREEKSRTTGSGYQLKYNTAIIGGLNDTTGILIWFDGELEFN